MQFLRQNQQSQVAEALCYVHGLRGGLGAIRATYLLGAEQCECAKVPLQAHDSPGPTLFSYIFFVTTSPEPGTLKPQS